MALQETSPDFGVPAATPPASTTSATPRGDRAKSVAKAFSEATIAPSLVSGSAAAFEFAALTAVGVLMERLWAAPASLGDYLPTVGASLLAVLTAQVLGANEVPMLRRHAHRLGRLLGVWAAVFSLCAVVMIVGDLTPALARSWYPVWFLSGFVTLIFAAAVSATAVRNLTRAGRLQKRAVIVGGGPLAESLINALETSGGNELKVLGIFDDRNDDRSPESQQGFPKLGNVNELVDFARVASVDMVIVSLPQTAEVRILQLLKKLWVLPLDIRLAAHSSKLRLRPRSYSYVGRVPFLDLFDRPIAGWDSVVKRVFDVTIASLAIVALSPVLLGTAIAVRLSSPGPILFRQKRYGFNNEVISVMKFRSMYNDKADYAASKVVTKGDPRVTPVGRFIRKTSLDELPQLFNVLKGDLSLVGPRPHAVNAHTEQRLWEEVVDGYFARHKVKPGVTGWAQINGWRGEVDTPDKIQARVEHDLHYIENWSVLFDLYILMLTPIRILNQENAY
ncbi:undecaprenyl-phosphate glucose phosphotransferase [Oryzibacter oryziterrae]|uniref:undecaprenyl-phosphate glucose phosphotransferase n=1 Tax=Oryzibacter oryziterrae TaxID=2766474 RepID=UPI001F35CFBE|nr:undecaprenyl-phosphate glucose phosphotransferase [Oryzibacter oryziterrae]